MAAVPAATSDADAVETGAVDGDLPPRGGSQMDVKWEQSVADAAVAAAQGASRSIWADAATAAVAEAQAAGGGAGGVASLQSQPSGPEHLDLGAPIR